MHIEICQLFQSQHQGSVCYIGKFQVQLIIIPCLLLDELLEHHFVKTVDLQKPFPGLLVLSQLLYLVSFCVSFLPLLLVQRFTGSPLPVRVLVERVQNLSGVVSDQLSAFAHLQAELHEVPLYHLIIAHDLELVDGFSRHLEAVLLALQIHVLQRDFQL